MQRYVKYAGKVGGTRTSSAPMVERKRGQRGKVNEVVRSEKTRALPITRFIQRRIFTWGGGGGGLVYVSIFGESRANSNSNVYLRQTYLPAGVGFFFFFFSSPPSRGFVYLQNKDCCLSIFRNGDCILNRRNSTEFRLAVPLFTVSDIHSVLGGQRIQGTSNEEARRDRETVIGLRASGVDKDLGFLEQLLRGSSSLKVLKLPSESDLPPE